MSYKFCFSLITPILIISGCDSQQKNNHYKIQQEKQLKTERIELTEQTRGTNRIFTFSSKSKTISLNGIVTTSDINPSEWQTLEKEIEDVNLSKISELKSPTTDRYTDKALISRITITSNEGNYQSPDFDAGKPPVELQNLYKKLQESAGKSGKKAKPAFR